MKLFIIVVIGVISLAYNLVNFGYIEFLHEVNLASYWLYPILGIKGDFFLVFDIFLSFLFMINIYQFHKILLIFGV